MVLLELALALTNTAVPNGPDADTAANASAKYCTPASALLGFLGGCAHVRTSLSAHKVAVASAHAAPSRPELGLSWAWAAPGLPHLQVERARPDRYRAPPRVRSLAQCAMRRVARSQRPGRRTHTDT